MANIDTPGFRPADRNPAQELELPVLSSNGTAIYVGDCVDIDATGGVVPSAGGGTNPTELIGVVVGIKDTNGVPIGHPNSAVSTKYLAASTAGFVTVALALPGRRFIAQAATGQTPAATDRFGTTDIVAGAGDATTARSGHELTFSDLNTGGQVLILDKVNDPLNTWGEHVSMYVVFNESIFGPNGKSTGV